MVAYISDHQAPAALGGVAGVLELCRGADVLIHDAQYSHDEFLAKPSWGHSPVDYTVAVAIRSEARRLCLFHYDPLHGGRAARRDGRCSPPRKRQEWKLCVAAEGLALTV